MGEIKSVIKKNKGFIYVFLGFALMGGVISYYGTIRIANLQKELERMTWTACWYKYDADSKQAIINTILEKFASREVANV